MESSHRMAEPRFGHWCQQSGTEDERYPLILTAQARVCRRQAPVRQVNVWSFLQQPHAVVIRTLLAIPLPLVSLSVSCPRLERVSSDILASGETVSEHFLLEHCTSCYSLVNTSTTATGAYSASVLTTVLACSISTHTSALKTRSLRILQPGRSQQK